MIEIATVTTTLVDLPTVRPHKLAFATVTEQNYVIVEITSKDGAAGIGEAATIGGPAWSYESTETIKTMIDTYLTPLLIGQDAGRFIHLAERMATGIAGNPFAKAAVEMALIDLTARTLGLPAHAMLGGQVTDRLPVAWTLASGDHGRDVEEGQEHVRSGRHRIFKIKIGAGDPRADVAHVNAIRSGLPDNVSVRVDVNQRWDEPTATRWIQALQDGGVDLVEQPVAADNVAAMRRLRERTTLAIMADEAVTTPHTALTLAQAGAADVFALKVTKAGGAWNTRAVASIAAAAGIPCYGGCMLETSVGTAACAHVFATLPGITFGCELFGPLLLRDTITVEQIVYEDGCIRVPDGPGFGMTLDRDKLAHFAREGSTVGTHRSTARKGNGHALPCTDGRAASA